MRLFHLDGIFSALNQVVLSLLRGSLTAKAPLCLCNNVMDISPLLGWPLLDSAKKDKPHTLRDGRVLERTLPRTCSRPYGSLGKIVKGCGSTKPDQCFPD